MSAKKQKKQKGKTVWAYHKGKKRWVRVSSKNPNCKWENGIFVRT